MTYYKEFFRKEFSNNGLPSSTLRLVFIRGDVCLLANDLEENEAVLIDLDKETLVELGKALIKAWETLAERDWKNKEGF